MLQIYFQQDINVFYTPYFQSQWCDIQWRIQDFLKGDCFISFSSLGICGNARHLYTARGHCFKEACSLLLAKQDMQTMQITHRFQILRIKKKGKYYVNQVLVGVHVNSHTSKGLGQVHWKSHCEQGRGESAADFTFNKTLMHSTLHIPCFQSQLV